MSPGEGLEGAALPSAIVVAVVVRCLNFIVSVPSINESSHNKYVYGAAIAVSTFLAHRVAPRKHADAARRSSPANAS